MKGMARTNGNRKSEIPASARSASAAVDADEARTALRRLLNRFYDKGWLQVIGPTGPDSLVSKCGSHRPEQSLSRLLGSYQEGGSPRDGAKGEYRRITPPGKYVRALLQSFGNG